MKITTRRPGSPLVVPSTGRPRDLTSTTETMNNKISTRRLIGFDSGRFGSEIITLVHQTGTIKKTKTKTQ